MRQHQREGQETESDHDRRQDERLGNGIRVRLDERLCAVGNDRRLRPGESAGGEDQQIRSVREQTDADDQLGEAAAKYQVDPGGVQHTGCEREEQLHLGVLREAEDHHQHHTPDDEKYADVEQGGTSEGHRSGEP